jgi:phosphoribosylformylglycinamidine synthase
VATAVHDISDGGLLVALAEMAMASGIGADLTKAIRTGMLSEVSPPPRRLDPADHAAYWFGEDQARYVVTVGDSDAAAVLNLGGNSRISVHRIGTTRGNALILPSERPILIVTLVNRFEGWLPAYMAGSAA